MYQPFCLLLINFIKLNFMESQQLKFQIFFDFLSNLIENLIFFFWILLCNFFWVLLCKLIYEKNLSWQTTVILKKILARKCLKLHSFYCTLIHVYESKSCYQKDAITNLIGLNRGLWLQYQRLILCPVNQRFSVIRLKVLEIISSLILFNSNCNEDSTFFSNSKLNFRFPR